MRREDLLDERLTYSVIGAFFEVYRHLRHGLLEHLYAAALERELRARGHRVGREVWVPVHYKSEEIGLQRLDMLVDDRVIVEVKSTRELHRSAARQLCCYLSTTRLETGLLLHFGPEPKFYRLVYSNTAETREGGGGRATSPRGGRVPPVRHDSKTSNADERCRGRMERGPLLERAETLTPGPGGEGF